NQEAVMTDQATAAVLEPVQRECTEEEGNRWQAEHKRGYEQGRSDSRWSQVRPDLVLAEIPPELPYETGAQYVARYVDLAYRVGYTGAVRWYSAHPVW